MNKPEKEALAAGSRSRYAVILVSILLITTISAVYWQVTNLDFVNIDDPYYVKNNSDVVRGITLDGIRWAFTAVHSANWHPLTWLSHMLDVQLFGMRPGLHHLTSVLFHILNTILLFMILRNMTGAIWRSAVVAFLFGLHPLHVESVAWISERKDVLSTFFWMLTMAAYSRYVNQGGITRYLAIILCYVLGLMSKPMLVTLPLVLLLLDFWPLSRYEEKHSDAGKEPRRYLITANKIKFLVSEKIPLLALAAISSVITYYAQKSGGSVVSQEVIPLATRIMNAVVTYATYLGKMLLPLRLAAYYPYHNAFQPLIVVACASMLVLITVLAFQYARKMPYLIVGWLWYLVTLIPVIGIVQVGDQSMADRYTYIPLIGIFLIISWGLRDLLGRWRYGKIALNCTIALIAVQLMWLTWIQIGYWKNSETLFRHTLDITSNNYFAHFNLAVALYEKGDIDGAIEQYEKALQAKPYHASSHKNLGNLLFLRNNIDGAIGHYLKALQVNRDDAGGYYNLGIAYYQKGDLEKAIESFQLALAKNPAYAEAMEKLRLARMRLKDIPDPGRPALRDSEEALQSYVKLGDSSRQHGKYDEAISYYQKAISIRPDMIKAHYGLVLTYSERHEYAQALAELQKIRQLQPDNPEIYYNIACMYAKQEMKEESIAWLKRSIDKGFHDLDLLRKDPDLASIRDTEFVRYLLKDH